MRALPILAALICTTAPLAKASTTELELLQSRCQEQERQIRQLEEENSRLKSLVSTAAKTPAPAQAAPAKAESKKEEETPKAAPAKTTDATSYGIVRAGDTLNKMARRHRISPEALAEANNLKKPFMIRAGQRLRLPEKPEASAKATETSKPSAATSEVAEVAKSKASSSEKPKATPRSGTHTVKAGETFFSIARHYGMSPNALQAVNPGVKSINLQVGQTLQLGGKPAAETKTTKSNSGTTAPAKTSEVDTVAATKSSTTNSSKHEVAKTTESSKPAAETKSAAAPAHEASAPAPAPAAAEQPAANGSRIRTVAIEENTPLPSFAAAHGVSIARLNALNGLNLNSGTVLAKGSELYVPAQP